LVQTSQNSEREGLLGAIGVSVALHVVVVAFVALGLPIFWEPEVLPGAIGIQLAEMSDITAAPKVQKEGPPKPKPPEPPKQEVKKEAPKKETPPPPPKAPAAAPPPPPPEEVVAEAIPDPEAEKKEQEKKKEEEKKKAEEEKKRKKKEQEEKKKEEAKKKKQEDQALDTLLANVLEQAPAPEPEQPTKKKAEAAPQEASTGPQTENVSEIPLTASEEDGIRGQIERNWNLGSLAGSPDLAGMLVELRIKLLPDGTVAGVEILNSGSSPYFRQAAESAKRAVMVSSPLQLPPGKTYDTMKLRFYPEQVMQ
jgi:outer membrane biosynthesis protein TonB